MIHQFSFCICSTRHVPVSSHPGHNPRRCCTNKLATGIQYLACMSAWVLSDCAFLFHATKNYECRRRAPHAAARHVAGLFHLQRLQQPTVQDDIPDQIRQQGLTNSMICVHNNFIRWLSIEHRWTALWPFTLQCIYGIYTAMITNTGYLLQA